MSRSCTSCFPDQSIALSNALPSGAHFSSGQYIYKHMYPNLLEYWYNNRNQVWCHCAADIYSAVISWVSIYDDHPGPGKHPVCECQTLCSDQMCEVWLASGTLEAGFSRGKVLCWDCSNDVYCFPMSEAWTSGCKNSPFVCCRRISKHGESLSFLPGGLWWRQSGVVGTSWYPVS